MTRVKQAGDRIEEILAGLRSGDPAVAAAAEELTGLLVGLYGDGLARIMAVLGESGPDGAGLIARLTEDPLVESLLLLHDLHPLDVDRRIQRALDQVRPYLGSHAGGVEYLGVTDGVARLRLEGSCHGCPSSTVTVRLAIEDAVKNAAPEVTEVVVEGMTEPPAESPALLQIGRRPDGAGMPAPLASPETHPAALLTPETHPAALATPETHPTALVSSETHSTALAADGDGAWVRLPDIGPPSSRPVSAAAGRLAVLVCAVRGTLYAYRDLCPACGSSMALGQLDREVLSCPCGKRYDVRAAGRGMDDPGLHLYPLPLLADSQGVRVAVPAAVAS